MKEKDKVSLLDWRFKFGIFLLVIAIVLTIIALILLPTAKFTARFGSDLGNGFWALDHYSLKDLIFNWVSLDDQAVMEAYESHPFAQVFVALLFLVFLLPIFFVLGVGLIIRWWVKTRI